MIQIPDRPNVLIVGSGGREHALYVTLARSPYQPVLFCAPGNGGIPSDRIVNISAKDVSGLREYAAKMKIDLTVVGPEDPLGAGIADVFSASGLRIFGPSRDGAQLELSKAFFAGFASRHQIPTPASEVLTDALDAKRLVTRRGAPIVIKASGPCLGKGVTVASTVEEAHTAINRYLIDREFGEAGATIVIQEFVEGHESSHQVITDGQQFIVLPASHDYKRLRNGDEGPMTGGMGGYSPEPRLTHQLEQIVVANIIQPTLSGLRAEGINFRGVLYFALMLTTRGPLVLEINVRFGDPELEALLIRLKSDLLPLLWGAAEGQLLEDNLEWDQRASVCVAAVSAGYPGKLAVGKPIHGLEAFDGHPCIKIFHGGTSNNDGQLVTSGGRVYYVTALGENYAVARGRAYQAMSITGFEGRHYRGDIAAHLV